MSEGKYAFSPGATPGVDPNLSPEDWEATALAQTMNYRSISGMVNTDKFVDAVSNMPTSENVDDRRDRTGKKQQYKNKHDRP